jgi:hypothetical protein
VCGCSRPPPPPPPPQPPPPPTPHSPGRRLHTGPCRCDHHADQRVAWHVDGDAQFAFVTQRPIPAGSPLWNNYGSTKGNEELILAYGFALEGNPHDSYLVNIATTASTQAGPARGGPCIATTASTQAGERRGVGDTAGIGMAAGGGDCSARVQAQRPWGRGRSSCRAHARTVSPTPHPTQPSSGCPRHPPPPSPARSCHVRPPQRSRPSRLPKCSCGARPCTQPAWGWSTP